jgi:hypothetical protein
MADQSTTTTTTPPSDKLLLDLDTTLDHPVVRVDGTAYPLRTPDATTVLAYKKTMRLCHQIGALETIEDPTEEQQREHENLLDQVCRRVLEAPDEIHAALSGLQREAIAQAFFRLPARTKRPLPAPVATPAPAEEAHPTVNATAEMTGATSSPA